MSQSSKSLVDSISDLARAKPEAILLMIAGGALLLRNGGIFGTGSTSASSNNQRSASGSYKGSEYYETAGNVGRDIRDTAQSYVSQAKESAAGYMESVQDYGHQVSDTIVRNTSDLREAARAQMSEGLDTISDQPALLIGLGVVAGMAAAAMLPRSRFEDEALRDVRKRVTGVADMATEKARTALSQASDKLKAEAEDRGFTPDKLKEAAGEIVSSVAGTLSESAGMAPKTSPQPEAHAGTKLP
jgi:gas vesicle protein